MRLALLCILALAATASAQPAPGKQPTQQQINAAKQHFAAAEAAKAKGDFKTAAVEYLAAYEQFNDPEFFFNVAEVYRLSNDEPNALMYYQKYLELDPTGRGAANARLNADALRRSIAAKEDAAKHSAEADAKRKAEEDAKRSAQAQQPVAQPQPEQEVDEPEPVTAGSPGRGMRIAGIATGGVGVVAIGVGVVFGLKSKSISNELSEADMFDQGRFDDGKAAERNMYIFTGVGVAALAAGGVLYYLGHRAGAQASDTVAVVPSVAPNQVGFVAAGHF